jgi:prefoldin subunit 5
MITIGMLEKRKEELKQEHTRLMANMNAVQGAIQIIDEIIQGWETPQEENRE